MAGPGLHPGYGLWEPRPGAKLLLLRRWLDRIRCEARLLHKPFAPPYRIPSRLAKRLRLARSTPSSRAASAHLP